MEDEQEFSFDSVQTCQSVVRYLKALVEGFERGELRLVAGTEELTLSPDGLLELEVRGKKRGGRAKLSFRLSWRESAGEEGLQIHPAAPPASDAD